MLLGLVRPSTGEISILGSSLGDDRAGVLSRVGYLVESAAAYPNLTVRENLCIQRKLTGAPRAAVDEVIGLLKLGEYVKRRAGRLSLGNAQGVTIFMSATSSTRWNTWRTAWASCTQAGAAR
jgi:ABC-2 type transport system ATP-binding protein